MSKRGLLGSSRDNLPWIGAGSTERARPETHEVETVAGAYVCRACAFATQDAGEVTAHVVASQFGRPPETHDVARSSQADDGGAA
jgi:hypothetical protein